MCLLADVHAVCCRWGVPAMSGWIIDRVSMLLCVHTHSPGLTFYLTLQSQRAEAQTSQLAAITEDCSAGLALLNERIVHCLPPDTSAGMDTSDAVSVWNEFIDHKDMILPAEEYTAVTARLEVGGRGGIIATCD